MKTSQVNLEFITGITQPGGVSIGRAKQRKERGFIVTNQAPKDPAGERKPGGCATSARNITGQENQMRGSHVIGSFGSWSVSMDHLDHGAIP